MPTRPRPEPRRLLAAGLVACLLLAGVLLAVGGRRVEPPPAPLPSATFAVATPPATEAPYARRSYPPRRLVIESLSVDAPLRPERVTAAGDLVVPGDPHVVGWWHAATAGQPPGRAESLLGPHGRGAAGTIVAAGHVSVSGDLGVLHDLHRLRPGSVVVTTDPAGAPQAWRVRALVVRHKDDLPHFPATGPRQLVLVTCGGPVLTTPAGTRSYRDNVLAVADPVAR